MSRPAPRIDAAQLRALVGSYLRMSLRGRAGAAFGGGQSGRPRGLIILLAIYVAIGCGAGTAAIVSRVELLPYAILLHAMTLGLVGLSVTAESGDVLFNLGESDVLGHRPLGSPTLLVAKALALLGFTLLLALALNVPAALAFGFGPSGPGLGFVLAHAVAVTLLAACCAAGVVLAYGLAVRTVGRERLEVVTAWSQVVLSVLFLLASQALPNLLALLAQAKPEHVLPYLFVFPPAWFAALDAIAVGTLRTAPVLGLAGLAVTATVVLTAAALHRLAPNYGDVLATLREAPSRPRTVRAPRFVGSLFARWWLGDPVERASFQLAATYLRRDRALKTRLYPSLVAFALLPLIGLFGPPRGPAEFAPLLSICMIGMLPGVALEALRMSPHHAAAELFVSAPLAGTGPVFHGVRKAAIAYLLVPGLLVTVPLTLAAAPAASPLILPGLVALPTFSLLPGIFGDYLPLAQPPARGQQAAKNALLMLGSTVTLGVLVGLSWASWRHGQLGRFLAAEILVAAALHWLLTRTIAARTLRVR